MAERFLPLILVSQIQRSGGSMMAQLLDGHPELLVHPHELHIGSPNKWDWPAFTLRESPEHWFNFLYEKPFENLVTHGYTKPGSNKFAVEDVFPFSFSIEKLRHQFLEYCAQKRPIERQRQILDAYFQAFFDAWEDHRPTGRELFVAAFTPRVVMYEPCVEQFFADYPDGKLISLVRNPCSWYASTVRHNTDHANLRFALREWLLCMDGIKRVADRSNVLVLIYEDVLANPQSSLSRVADFIGIKFDPILLRPSYLRQPVRPNSSFDIDVHGINTQMIDRRDSLPAPFVKVIEDVAMPAYRELVRQHGLGSLHS
ncbi:MAG TPA: sulfotransferase [Xanthobacteraceae bacterium]|nr:sulfotransferase [Xanthobacteraceae bacterium]